jgi:hypothetical protein
LGSGDSIELGDEIEYVEVSVIEITFEAIKPFCVVIDVELIALVKAVRTAYPQLTVARILYGYGGIKIVLIVELLTDFTEYAEIIQGLPTTGGRNGV